MNEAETGQSGNDPNCGQITNSVECLMRMYRSLFLPSGVRPAWQRVALACVSGVVAGGVTFAILLYPIHALLNLAIGETKWQEVILSWPDQLGRLILVPYLVLPLALGQWFGILLCRWRKSAYFSAALQTVAVVLAFSTFGVAYLWALPALIALAFNRLDRASNSEETGSILETRSSG